MRPNCHLYHYHSKGSGKDNKTGHAKCEKALTCVFFGPSRLRLIQLREEQMLVAGVRACVCECERMGDLDQAQQPADEVIMSRREVGDMNFRL